MVTEGKRSTPREGLIATVAVMRFREGDILAAWHEAEAWVAALEQEPDKPAKCPCCTKLVTLCVKHYQLYEPGKLCSMCRGEK
jgi:hypothetical protein